MLRNLILLQFTFITFFTFGQNSNVGVAIIADQELEEGVLKLCPGETVTFTAAVTYEAKNQSNETSFFKWDVLSEVPVTQLGLTEYSFTFNQAAGYNLLLTVTDSQGNNGFSELLIQVSPTPDFSSMLETFQDSICLNNSVTLDGSIPTSGQGEAGVSSAGGSFIVEGSFNNPLDLPDGGATDPINPLYYSSVITINEYPDGTTLDNVQDFIGVCMNLHHTYVSDLEMWLVSPSNDTLLLFDGYYDQASGTGLFPGGVPLGGTNFGNPPNEGYSYCFSAASINSFEDPTLENPIPTGDYLPMGNVNNFQGSLVNGDWTLFVGDYFSADAGFINNWFVDFSEELVTLAPDYEPVLLNSYWEGYSDDVLELTPTEMGQVEYQIIVSDDYDCSFEKTLTLTVLEPDCTVGIDEFENNIIQVYPNPSEGVFKINVIDNELFTITIYNELGEVILAKENLRSQTYTADLGMHADGLYLGQIVTKDGQSLLFKILKK